MDKNDILTIVTNIFLQRIANMTEAERYRAVGAFYVGSEYVWGKEIPTGADCSGLISGALMGAGHQIRVTADMFLKEVFTDNAYGYDPSKIQAAFFVTNKEYDTPDGKRPKDIARHVVMLIGDNVVINANSVKNVIEYRALDDLEKIFEAEDCYMVIKSLNSAKALKMEGQVYGLDEEIKGD